MCGRVWCRALVYVNTRSLISKLTIGQYDRCDETPGVESQTQPAGYDFHPHGGSVRVQRLQ